VSQAPESLPPLTPRAALGWGTVRTGLQLVLVGTLLALIGLFVLALRLLDRHGWEEPDLAVALVLVLLWSGLVLGVAGTCLGFAVPKETGLRQQATGFVTSLGVAAAFAVALFLLRVVPDPHDPIGRSRAEKALEVGRPALAALVLLTEAVYFLFLRGVAAYFQERRLVRRLAWCLLLTLLLQGGVLVVAWRAEQGLPNPLPWVEHWERDDVIGLLVGVGVLSALLYAWFLLLVRGVRGAITRALLRR
jgi:hypothetical protein